MSACLFTGTQHGSTIEIIRTLDAQHTACHTPASDQRLPVSHKLGRSSLCGRESRVRANPQTARSGSRPGRRSDEMTITR